MFTHSKKIYGIESATPSGGLEKRCYKMAEGWTTNSVLCRYYLNGACREGSRCHFSHDRDSAQPSNVCRYYLRGQCAYGERCRYDHVKPRNSSQSAAAVGSSSPKGVVGRNNNTSSHLKLTGTTLNHNNETPSNSKVNPSTRQPLESNFNSQTGRGLSTMKVGRMTILHKQGQSKDSGIGDESGSPCKPGMSEWVYAPEFIPGDLGPPKSYAEIVDPIPGGSGGVEESSNRETIPSEGLCPYALVRECPYGESCSYMHGDICELCGYPCLHPTDKEQRKKHTEECMNEHERNMELSFAVQRSKDKTCGICMDIIMEKTPPNERRFGILSNCNHVFCLSCIRKWRNAKQFENKIIRACPECRIASDFVTPSKFWVDTKEDKEKLITDYKKALSLKPCKYFKQGRGECPFAGNCFYLHAYPDGTKAELPPPRPRRRHNADGELSLMQRVILWDFFEERDSRWLFQFDLEDMLEFFSDSDDDSEWSEYDLFFD